MIADSRQRRIVPEGEGVPTIKQLLDRIRWDPAFGGGEFELGYYDRIQKRILRVPLRELIHPPGRDGFFEFMDDSGERRSVPLHRIRDLYKDGELIWHRPSP